MLLNNSFSLGKRLRLFDSTVSGAVLWGTESWVPRVQELRQLQSTQNAMLRKVVGSKRKPDETYVDWNIRATHRAWYFMTAAGAKTCIDSHFQRKWRWAGHIARMHESESVSRTTFWRDRAWEALVPGVWLRPSRRRWMKFDDVLRRFAEHNGWRDWSSAAGDRQAWRELEAPFSEWASAALV